MSAEVELVGAFTDEERLVQVARRDQGQRVLSLELDHR